MPKQFSLHSLAHPALLAAVLALSTAAHAGMLDKAKAAKESLDKAANQPVKVSIGSGNLVDHADDIAKVMAGFKKKIGTDPVMIYGARLSWTNQVTLTYQNRYNKEKLETLVYARGEIGGKPGEFKLIGQNVKVADNVFDLGRIKLDAIPGLVKQAREKTAQATKNSKTLGASVDLVQSWSGGTQNVRIVVHVAADDKSTAELIGGALTSLKDDKPAKGSSVGQLIADETGKILDFRLK